MQSEMDKCYVFLSLLSVIPLEINWLGKKGANLQHILNYINKTHCTSHKLLFLKKNKIKKLFS